MAGLLAFPQFASLMSGMNPAAMAKPRPMMADAEDERMFAANPNGDQLNQLLGALLLGQKEPPAMAQAAPMPSSAVQAAPGGAIATPKRDRVSPWRVLDRVLGGETITGGLDAERGRLEQEAMRPQMMARAQENEAIARALGPQALLALRTNPEAIGESLGYQYRPQVVANGAIQSTPGMGQVLENEDEFAFGDSIVRAGRGGVQTLATRGPTIAEGNDAERNRIAALGAGQSTVGRFRLGPDGQPIFEAPSEVTLSQGQKRFENGVEVAAVAPTPVRNPKDDEDRAAIKGLAANNARFQSLIKNIEGYTAEDGTVVVPEFDLSPAAALGYKAALATGVGMSPAAAAYGDYVSEINSAVSDALRLNVGPQTDQDAIREARALLSNIDNKAYVLRRLPTVIANNERLAAGRQALINERGSAGGAGPAGAAPVPVTSPQEAMALPPGTQFVTPDGQVRTRR